MARRFGINAAGEVYDRKTGREATPAQATEYRTRLRREALRRQEREALRTAAGRAPRPGRSRSKPSESRRAFAREKVYKIREQQAKLPPKRRRRIRREGERTLDSRDQFGAGAEIIGHGPLSGFKLDPNSMSSHRAFSEAYAVEIRRRGVKGPGVIRSEFEGRALYWVNRGAGAGTMVEEPFAASFRSRLHKRGKPSETVSTGIGMQLADGLKGHMKDGDGVYPLYLLIQRLVIGKAGK